VPYKTWTSAEDAQAWLARMKTLCESGTAQQLVLLRRTDGKVVGTLLVFKYDEGSSRVEIGYVLGRPYWGQGFMQEALKAFCDHAFGAMGLRRLEAEVNPTNLASCKLLATTGFRHEGTLRKRWTAKGETYDVNAYGLLADDPR
jgi:RimJ/RimL family protein N-acetyltransferase